MFGRAAPRNSDNTRYYEILGLSKIASQDELKKAYKKAAINNHPDKGGDPEKANCRGDKVVPEKKIHQVIVEKGMANGQKITFPGEADEAREHPKFFRKGDHLFNEQTLAMTEALYGFQFALTHLDGRKLLIKSDVGQVVKPNDEGMPIYQRPFMRGKLYIHFNVEFPDKLTQEQRETLTAVLPQCPPTGMELDECEETTMHDVNIEEEMRRRQGRTQEAYDEDDEMHGPGGGQRVQCAQQ